MRRKAISISSDSSDDDVPLNMVKFGSKDPNCYDSLRQNCPESCEFCDRISKNRYSSLIHNVKHIIIPLIKQNILQCSECLHSFTSESQLRNHMVKKHPDIPINVLVKKDNFSDNNVDITKIEKIEIGNHKPSDLPPSISYVPDNGVSMKSRLVFEDDDPMILDCSQVLNDLTTDCKVNIELFNTPWMNGYDDFRGKSIHYKELMKPGVYRCRKCTRSFPVRFDAIVHEGSHLKIKNSQVSLCVICKQYLVGGGRSLRHHYLTYHKDGIEGRTEKTDLELDLPKFFDEDVEVRFVFGSKLVRLCELCYSFCKTTSNIIYECIKTLCEVGKRYKCQKCRLRYYEIKIVKRSVRKRMIYGPNFKRKRKTNEDRLKIIVNRFKMMKH